MKPRSLRSLGPVKSSTFFLLKQDGVGGMRGDGGGEMMEDRKQREKLRKRQHSADRA